MNFLTNQIYAILYRFSYITTYKNCFPDVTEEWFARYVCYAKSAGWISGHPDGTFKPGDPVNKAEATKMLVNSQGYEVPILDYYKTGYVDVIGDEWFIPFIKVAEEKGLLEERAILNEEEFRTRATISENIYRAMVIAEGGHENYKEFLNAPEPKVYDPNYTLSSEENDLLPINLKYNLQWEIDFYQLDTEGKRFSTFYRVTRDFDKFKLVDMHIDSKSGEAVKNPHQMGYSPSLQENYVLWMGSTRCSYEYIELGCSRVSYTVPFQIDSSTVELGYSRSDLDNNSASRIDSPFEIEINGKIVDF